MPRVIRVTLLVLAAALLFPARPPLAAHEAPLPDAARVARAFQAQGLALNTAEAQGILRDVHLALREARAHGIGNSKVDFAAVQIASDLGLPLAPGSDTKRRVLAALRALLGERGGEPRPLPAPAWGEYFDSAVGLWHRPDFMRLVTGRGFHPVQISWEDIGRHEGSVWGDRISDVGIWVRRDEADPGSAQLALSVRRDSNFRDKVLMVPAERIKVHQRRGDRTIEKTLPERLRELGVASPVRDRNVIVSNQFAIVPVPSRAMRGAWRDEAGAPPRAAFTFSIFPYGSTNLVITDVIEGSHEAIVGPGQHQLLFANVDGRRAPFTASRAEDRPDLLRLERELKAQGMDVDVQRYYLIQVPLRRDVAGLQLSNMGTPPLRRAFADAAYSAAPSPALETMQTAPAAGAPLAKSQEAESDRAERRREPGLARVAIGTGETEGPYFAGAGFRGARADEPVRVTVVYFVTPVGPVTARDMDTFARAFEQWDGQAIWGGSFVVKE
jgi:hypothetical protein